MNTLKWLLYDKLTGVLGIAKIYSLLWDSFILKP